MRWGLLGTGDWARRTHAAALAAAPDTELVAVWGRDPAKAAALAADHGATAYGDVDALIEAVDAVAIALPPAVQAPLAARAARAGRHLLLDKPLALTVAAADEVVEAVGSTGVSSVILFTNRFKPAVADWLATAGEHDWDGGRATILGHLSGELWETSGWRREHGGLWDVGPHALSILVPVLGPVVDVAAAAGPHATTTVLLTHAGGRTSTMTLSLSAPPAAGVWDFAFWGEAGWASVPVDGDAVAACVRAIGELAPDHPCGVRFGRDVVEVLARAERARG
jgi:predicted dehydrogenase